MKTEKEVLYREAHTVLTSDDYEYSVWLYVRRYASYYDKNAA